MFVLCIRNWNAGIDVVSESLPEFCGKNEAGIGGDTIDPLRGVFGAKRLIERSVDFDGVKEFSEIGGFVKVLGVARRINVAEPVRVRPPGRADAGQFCAAQFWEGVLWG